MSNIKNITKDIIIKCGFQRINTNIIFTNSKGKNLADSGHVTFVTEVRPPNNFSIITANILRQMSVSLHPWKVKLELDKRCFCNCPARASEKCKHIAALIYYINNEDSFSKTDFPQEWGKLSKVGKEKYKKGQKIEQLFPPIKKQKKFLSISHYDIVNTYNILSINCGVNKLIQEELLSEDDKECKMCLNEIVDNIEIKEIFVKNDRLMSSVIINQSSNDHRNVKNEDNFYFNRVVVKKEEVKSVFNSTLEQSNNTSWTENRKIRISATKYHKIKICKNMSAENQQKIVDIISNDVKLIGKAAFNTAYGTQTEMTAIEAYCEMLNKKTIKAGLIIHYKYPWFCASPDSLVLSQNGEINKILEIKYPVSCKNRPIVDENTRTLNLKYLKYENGKVVLRSSHQYIYAMPDFSVCF